MKGWSWANVRFGSKGDMRLRQTMFPLPSRCAAVEKFGSRFLPPRVAEGVILQNNSLQRGTTVAVRLATGIPSDFWFV
jgi:hypothetical protein